MTIGQKIKKARKQAGLTQKDLGTRLGLSFQAVAQWENDLRNPKQETLIKIAKALDIPVNELLDVYNAEVVNEIQQIKIIEQYFHSLGIEARHEVKKWHYGDVIQDPDIRERIPDEWHWVLSKNGFSATFTESEFADLQNEAKEAIEGKFYKKIVQQEKK